MIFIRPSIHGWIIFILCASMKVPIPINNVLFENFPPLLLLLLLLSPLAFLAVCFPLFVCDGVVAMDGIISSSSSFATRAREKVMSGEDQEAAGGGGGGGGEGGTKSDTLLSLESLPALYPVHYLAFDSQAFIDDVINAVSEVSIALFVIPLAPLPILQGRLLLGFLRAYRIGDIHICRAMFVGSFFRAMNAESP
jgi:hypothetical protein